jgi:hypothetical protein
VLDEHFIDGGDGEVRVERLAADIEELVEGFLEGAIRAMCVVDLLLERFGQFRDALLELVDGLLEAFDIRLGVAVERV